jgi:hypothetical protein
MRNFRVTICYYGRTPLESEYNTKTVDVISDSKIHAEWKAADELGIQQYYAAYSEEIN